METAYAFLAKNADFEPEGSLTVISADLSTVKADRFPYEADALVLVGKFRFPLDECERNYQFTVEVYAPNNVKMDEDVVIPLRVGLPDPPKQMSSVGLVVNFQGAVFQTQGEYSFRLKLDDQEIRTLSLNVIQSFQVQETMLANPARGV